MSASAASHWQEARLLDVARSDAPIGYGIVQSGPYVRDGVPVVAIRDLPTPSVQVAHRCSRDIEAAYRRSRVCSGDVLISVKGTTGRIGLVPHEFAGNISRDVARIRLTDEHSPAYWFQMLQSPQAQRTLQQAAVGSTRQELSIGALKMLSFRFPDRRDQERVADILSDVDDLIAALERIIAKKQAIKRGMLQQLLTGGTRLPGFTAAWLDTLLGDHVSYVKTVALSRAQLDSASPVRYLHYGDVHTRNDVRLDAAHEPMPRANSSLLRNAGRLRVGDVVFADASEDAEGVGKSVEITGVPEEGVVPGLHTIAARFDKAILADGFKAYLQFIPSFRQALLRLAAGTKVLATTRSFISSITLTLPGIEEQRAIAAALNDADREVQRLQVRLEKTRLVKQGMMQALLRDRTRLPVGESAA